MFPLIVPTPEREDLSSVWRAIIIRQSKVEGGAFVRFARGPGVPPVSIDNPLHCCQSHTGSREFSHCMQPLKYAEEPPCVGHVKSRAIVPHEKRFLRILRDPELDPRV